MPEHRARQHHRDRIASTFQEEITALLEGELSDPRIAPCYVTEVILTPGGKSCSVLVAVYGDEKAESETLEGLMAARGLYPNGDSGPHGRSARSGIECLSSTVQRSWGRGCRSCWGALKSSAASWSAKARRRARDCRGAGARPEHGNLFANRRICKPRICKPRSRLSCWRVVTTAFSRPAADSARKPELPGDLACQAGRGCHRVRVGSDAPAGEGWANGSLSRFRMPLPRPFRVVAGGKSDSGFTQPAEDSGCRAGAGMRFRSRGLGFRAPGGIPAREYRSSSERNAVCRGELDRSSRAGRGRDAVRPGALRQVFL